VLMQIQEGPWLKFEHDLDAIVRLQNVMLAAAEGTRDEDLNNEFMALRTAVLNVGEYRDLVPLFVKTNRDLKALWPFFKSFDPQWEPRRKMIRDEFEQLIERAEKNTFSELEGTSDSSEWTGVQSARQRLVAIKTLAPVAQASIETLIASLEATGHDSGPPLDEHTAAIENLRNLHKKLGELLELKDEGQLNSDQGSNLLIEIARYGKRAARELHNDPMPYAMSATLLSILTVFGAPGIASYLATVALLVRKNVS